MSAVPICGPLPNRSENTPSGRPHSRTLSCIARPTSSLVPGCAACAFTITVLPPARRKQCLLQRRRTPEENCWRQIRPRVQAGATWSGCRASVRVCDWGRRDRHVPAPTIPLPPPGQTGEVGRRFVRFRLAGAPCGKAVSWAARSTISAAIDSIFAAIVRKNAPRSRPDMPLVNLKRFRRQANREFNLLGCGWDEARLQPFSSRGIGGVRPFTSAGALARSD